MFKTCWQLCKPDARGNQLSRVCSIPRYPFKLFWLIKKPPLMVCNMRRDIAGQVLGANSDHLEPTTRKIRDLCKDELRHCFESGIFEKESKSPSGPLLFCLIKSIALLMPSDTQVIEGMNSIVKLIGRRCPNITLELLSGRLVVKRFLSGASSDGSVGCRRKYSSIKGFAEEAVKELSQLSNPALSILANVERWATAKPADFDASIVVQEVSNKLSLVDADMLHDVRFPEFQLDKAVLLGNADATSSGQHGSCDYDFRCQVPAEAVEWAKKRNILWKRAAAPNKRQKRKINPDNIIPPSSMIIAMMQCTDCEWPEFFLVVESFAHSVQFARLETVIERGTRRCKWQYKQRPHAVPSTLLFIDFWWICTKFNVSVRVFIVQIDRWMVDALFDKGIPMGDIIAKGRFVMNLTTAKKLTTRGRPKGSKNKAKMMDIADIDIDIESDMESSGSDRSDQPSKTKQYIKSNVLEDCSDDDDDSNSDSDNSSTGLCDPDDDLADVSASKIKSAQDRGCCPPDQKVIDLATTLQQEAGGVPEAEVQEEALLLLIQKSKDEKLELGRKSRTTATKKTRELARSLPLDESDDENQNNPDENLKDCLGDCFSEHIAVSTVFGNHGDAIMGTVLCRWLQAFVKTLLAMRTYASTKHFEIGHDRSLALILQIPVDQPINGCHCLRCKCRDDSNDILLVHWLNNGRLTLRDRLVLKNKICSKCFSIRARL